jgi:hypothetical protein
VEGIMAILVELSRWVDGKQEIVAPPTYVGQVIRVDCHADSLWECDNYRALVWDSLLNAPRDVVVGGRRWGSAGDGPPMSQCAEVDATPEVLAAYGAYQARMIQELETKNLYYQATKLEVGKMVKVVKGRKLPKGLVGHVTRIGESAYGMWAIVRYEDAGVMTEKLTNVANLEVIPDMSWW